MSKYLQAQLVWNVSSAKKVRRLGEGIRGGNGNALGSCFDVGSPSCKHDQNFSLLSMILILFRMVLSILGPNFPLFWYEKITYDFAKQRFEGDIHPFHCVLGTFLDPFCFDFGCR